MVRVVDNDIFLECFRCVLFVTRNNENVVTWFYSNSFWTVFECKLFRGPRYGYGIGDEYAAGYYRS